MSILVKLTLISLLILTGVIASTGCGLPPQLGSTTSDTPSPIEEQAAVETVTEAPKPESVDVAPTTIVVEAEGEIARLDTVGDEAAALPAGDYAAEDAEADAVSVEAFEKEEILDAPSVAGEAPVELKSESEAATADHSRSGGVVIQQTPPLRAGEVDDNTQWDDYLLYRRNYRGPQVHDREIDERYIVEVTDAQGNPLLGAEVSIYLAGQGQPLELYQAKTLANGQILFHPLTLGLDLADIDRFTVEVQHDNLVSQFTLPRFEAQPTNSFTEKWTIALDQQPQFEALNLDILFLIDATGSMADEIDKIQSTIFDVAAQIDALPGQPNTRYGMVTYRDRDDSFVSNSYEFTPDVGTFHQNLATVFADGGGDYPESLNEGLHHALHSVEWRGADTIQLIFLVADAPPHLDYEQDYDYAVEMEQAARRGIKIFPIASSGLDDQGEYIFRQLAQYTQGRFIFLTYEDSSNGGAPGDTTTHHVDDYSVDNLDNLLVKLVREELAYQNPQLSQAQ